MRSRHGTSRADRGQRSRPDSHAPPEGPLVGKLKWAPWAGLATACALTLTLAADVVAQPSAEPSRSGVKARAAGTSDATTETVPAKPPEVRPVAGTNPNLSCLASDACHKLGLCAQRAGTCVAGSDADCRRSRGCAAWGRCAARGGRCVVRSSADCRRSDGCRKKGLCRQQDRTCVAADVRDCRASHGCSHANRCHLDRAQGVCTQLAPQDYPTSTPEGSDHSTLGVVLVAFGVAAVVVGVGAAASASLGGSGEHRGIVISRAMHKGPQPAGGTAQAGITSGSLTWRF